MLIAVLMKNQKIDDLFTAFTLRSATLDRAIPPIRENIRGFVKTSANSVMFIDRTTAWFPARAKIMIPIIATIPSLINLPASGGG